MQWILKMESGVVLIPQKRLVLCMESFDLLEYVHSLSETNRADRALSHGEENIIKPFLLMFPERICTNKGRYELINSIINNIIL